MVGNLDFLWLQLGLTLGDLSDYSKGQHLVAYTMDLVEEYLQLTRKVLWLQRFCVHRSSKLKCIALAC